MRQQGRTNHSESDCERVEVGHHVLTQHRTDKAVLGGRCVAAAAGHRPGGHMPAPVYRCGQIRPAVVEVVAAGAHRGQAGLVGPAFEECVESLAHVVRLEHGVAHQLRVKFGVRRWFMAFTPSRQSFVVRSRSCSAFSLSVAALIASGR